MQFSLFCLTLVVAAASATPVDRLLGNQPRFAAVVGGGGSGEVKNMVAELDAGKAGSAVSQKAASDLGTGEAQPSTTDGMCTDKCNNGKMANAELTALAGRMAKLKANKSVLAEKLAAASKASATAAAAVTAAEAAEVAADAALLVKQQALVDAEEAKKKAVAKGAAGAEELNAANAALTAALAARDLASKEASAKAKAFQAAKDQLDGRNGGYFGVKHVGNWWHGDDKALEAARVQKRLAADASGTANSKANKADAKMMQAANAASEGSKAAAAAVDHASKKGEQAETAKGKLAATAAATAEANTSSKAAKAEVVRLKAVEADRKKAKAAAKAEVAKLKGLDAAAKTQCKAACMKAFDVVTAATTAALTQEPAGAATTFGALQGMSIAQAAMNAAMSSGDSNGGYLLLLQE